MKGHPERLANFNDFLAQFLFILTIGDVKKLIDGGGLPQKMVVTLITLTCYYHNGTRRSVRKLRTAVGFPGLQPVRRSPDPQRYQLSVLVNEKTLFFQCSKTVAPVYFYMYVTLREGVEIQCTVNN